MLGVLILGNILSYMQQVSDDMSLEDLIHNSNSELHMLIHDIAQTKILFRISVYMSICMMKIVNKLLGKN